MLLIKYSLFEAICTLMVMLLSKAENITTAFDPSTNQQSRVITEDSGTLNENLVTSTFKQSNSKKNLTFGALLPFLSNNDKFHYASALKVAVNLINADPNILANYNIQVEALETAGQTGFALVNLFSFLESDAPIAAIIGPTDTKTVKITSKLCSARNILQVSFSAVEPELGDKNQFSTLFRSNPDRVSVNLALFSLFKYNNWKRTAILYDVEDLVLFQTAQDLFQLMINNSINVTAFEAFASSRQSAEDYDVIERKIELFKMKDVRIILLGVKAVSLKYIFCEAYKQNMIGPRYFWIVLFEDMFSDWFSSKNVNCTSEQLLVASNGFMYVSFAALRRDGEVTIANKTADEVWQLVKDQVNSLYSVPPSTISYNVLSMYAYDGLWALAKLLDTAEKTLKTFNIDLLLERNATLVMQLTDLMEKIKFQGVSGQYSYLGKNSRDRIGDVLFMQFIPNGTYTEVGYLNSELDEIYFNTTKQSLLMPGFFFPKDGPVVREIPMIFSLQVLIVIWSFVAAGIILSLSFLSANIKYRKVGLIKLSSPNINNAIIVGCMLCYVSVALYGIDSRIVKAGNIPSTCNAVIIILSTGFTLSFGGLFSKTWRIYKIFIKSRSLSSNGIRDLHLFGVLLVLLLIDSVVFTVWMTVSPFKLHFDFMDSVINDVDDTVVKPVIYRCRCKYQNQFSVALYAYKGVLLIFGLFVAWETRNIKITVINDSRYIGMAVYNVAVLSTIGAISTAAIQGTPYFQIGYLTFSICIIVCTTLTLLVIFAPKIRMLSNGFEDPHFKNGRPIISSHSSMQGRKMSTQATSLKLHTITENWSNPMMLESTDTASSTMNSLTNTCGSYNNTAYET